MEKEYEWYWEAYAEYEDGTSVRKYFDPNEHESENDQQYHLEEWLLTRHPGCTFYTVNVVYE